MSTGRLAGKLNYRTLWLTVELIQSAPAYKNLSSDSKQSVNKARGHVNLENNGKTLWGYADWTASSKSRGGVYFACLGGRSYLSPEERSIPQPK